MLLKHLRRHFSFIGYPKSFLRLLLVGFLLVALPATAVLVQTLYSLDRIANESGRGINEAARLAGGSQRLAEQTVMMERSARQFLILKDSALRQRYRTIQASARQNIAALKPLASPSLSVRLDEWLATESHISQLFDMRPPPADAASRLALSFAKLAEVNRDIISAGNGQIDAQASALLTRIQLQQMTLTWLVALVVVSAVGLAFVFATVIHRPIRQIDQGIRRLGVGDLAEPIHVTGPADLTYLGSRLDWLRSRLAELEAEKSRFLRHISHELKTPLAAIREGAELLSEEVPGKMTLGQREIVAILRENSLELQDLIEGLLAYNAAKFAATRAELALCRLDHLVSDVAARWKMTLDARALELKLRVEPVSCAIDVNKWQVIVDNLLSNAVKFTPNEGQVRLWLGYVDQSIVLECRDSGVGVAPEDVEHIFEPFYQGVRQGDRNTLGNGIGLSIVREFVELHHGQIVLLPSESGAYFRITLPMDSE